jgi:hypothetical protein
MTIGVRVLWAVLATGTLDARHIRLSRAAPTGALRPELRARARASLVPPQRVDGASPPRAQLRGAAPPRGAPSWSTAASPEVDEGSLPFSARACIFAVQFSEAVQSMMLFPFLPFMMEGFGVPTARLGVYAGMLSSSYCFASFLMTPLVSSASDTIGVRPTMLFTIAVGIGAMLMFGTASSFKVRRRAARRRDARRAPSRARESGGVGREACGYEGLGSCMLGAPSFVQALRVRPCTGRTGSSRRQRRRAAMAANGSMAASQLVARAQAAQLRSA